MGDRLTSSTPTMKLVGFSALLALAAASPVEWLQFKTKFNKAYTATEDARRLAIFKENLAFIERHNQDYLAGIETHHVGVNQFADLTNAEYRQQHLAQTQESVGIRLNYQCPVNFAASGNALPDSVDWRSTANPKSTVAVTSVKDQGSCGSCWSFGGAATFEGAMCLAGSQDCTTWSGASVQELVDCGGKDNTALGPYYDMACNGGWIDNALYYIMQNGGISGYDSYGYTSGTTQRAGTCNPQGASVGTLNTCGATAKNSESDLQAAVAEQGVIGIAIDAGGIGFQLYSGGVYTSNTCSSSRLNHAVTCVGYGSDSNDVPYWTVKNSWGTAWGDNGYILMQRNYNNMCGVAATPAYAIAP